MKCDMCGTDVRVYYRTDNMLVCIVCKEKIDDVVKMTQSNTGKNIFFQA